MQDPNKNNIPLHFDLSRTVFTVVTWALLNLCFLVLVAGLAGAYLMHTNNDVSSNSQFSYSFKIGYFALAPLNWFYWKTKMSNGKWRYLFYRD